MSDGAAARADAPFPDRLFPAGTRAIARALFAEVRVLSILSPPGHTDPRWFAAHEPFTDRASLLLTPDPYITRMLYCAARL